MKILLPVKRVIDGDVPVRLDLSGACFDEARLKTAMNPFDEVAVEAALRLKEAGRADDVVAVGVGPSGVADTLRTALAIGADRARLVRTDEAVEHLAVARILAAVCAEEKPDLVIAGRQATDDDAGAVGPMLAALMGWPQAVGAVRLDVGDDDIAAACETESGLRVLRLTMPAVLCVDLRLHEPRFVTLPGLMKARKKPLTETTPDALGVAVPSRIARLTLRETPPRPPGIMVESASALAAILKTKEPWR